jgi:periplasmic divalent cation tolerance protein
MSERGIVTVYAVFADADEAHRIARILVEERLAACANVLGPCRSIYRWQGAIEEADEVPALFKTGAHCADALIARIAELHSYDVPAAVAWPITAAHAPYGEWVKAQAGD